MSGSAAATVVVLGEELEYAGILKFEHFSFRCPFLLSFRSHNLVFIIFTVNVDAMSQNGGRAYCSTVED